MQKFILKRVMQYTERAEIEAENWDAAKVALRDENTEFETHNDDMLHDEIIEYVGEV